MIKKRLVLLMVVCVLFGMSACNSREQMSKETIKSSETTDEDIAVPDTKTAHKIAKNYMEEVKHYDLNKYKRPIAEFDWIEEIWGVMYQEKNADCGGTISIAISQKDGEILRTWMDE